MYSNISTIPIKNLSSSDIDVSNLKGKGMNYSFVDKNKFLKRNIAVEMEALAVSLDKPVDTQSKGEKKVNLLKMFTIHKIILSNL